MNRKITIKQKLGEVFKAAQARVLAEVITAAYDDLVKTSDFNELKGIVKELAEAQKELAEAQKRTEIRLNELAEAQKRTEIRLSELAEAQKRTEIRLNELAEAQKRTEIRLNELAEAQKRTEIRLSELAEAQKGTEFALKTLAEALAATRQDLGGLSQSMGYAFENEAYRSLPRLLQEKHHLMVKERLIRTEIAGEEVNIFVKGERQGKEVLVVGEAKLSLDGKKAEETFAQLEEKVQKVAQKYGSVEIIRLIATHYASRESLRKAGEKGILVVQSFEW